MSAMRFCKSVARSLANWGFSAMVFASCSVLAQEWTHTSINAPSLTTQPYAPDQIGFAYLRVAISGFGPGWSIEFDYGPAGVIVVDERNVGTRLGMSLPGRYLIDLPAIKGQTVVARSNQAALKAVPVEIIGPGSVHAEQKIDGSSVDSVTPGVGRLANAEKAFARLELLSNNGLVVALCTAFRVAKGYWLTAGHCLYRDVKHADSPVYASFRLQPAAYAGLVGQDAPFLATRLASGLQSSALPSPASILKAGDLDYGLLEAASDPGGPVLPLPVVPAKLRAGTELLLLQYWIGDIPPDPGKAVASGTSCKVFDRLGPDDASRPELCPTAIQHGCSSRDGASGGPVLDRLTLQPVAVHYGAGREDLFNCALPLSSVRADLCSRLPEVARKVTLCE